MKGWSVSQKGKRVAHTRGRVKLLPLFLVAAMLSGMLLTSSVGAEGVPTDSRDQVTDKGRTLYYNSKGVAVDGQQGYDVSVNKTVTQAVDGSGKPIENRFKVDLAVETTTNYTTIETTKDAAVVLVLDFSSSMDECAECGRLQKPSSNREGYLMAKAHIEEGKGAQIYCGPESTWSNSTGIYTPSDGVSGSDCRSCWQAYARADDTAAADVDGKNHYLQHKFVSRWEVAKQDTLEFLKMYVDGAKGADRYVSIVTFGSTASLRVDRENYAQKTASDITAIVDDIFNATGTETNTTAAMVLAKSLIEKETVVPKNQSSVILMSDGLPSQVADGASGTYSGKNFAVEYKALTDYCVANKDHIFDFKDIDTRIYNTARIGFEIRDLGASLYTVGFAAGYNTSGGVKKPAFYLAEIMEKFSDKGYDANSAAGLGDAFTDIIKKMTELKPNTVTDVLPAEFKYVSNTFTGKGAAAAAASDDGTISWILTKLEPDSSANGHHTYKLSYEMTLDNSKMAYVNGVAPLLVNPPQQAPTFGFTPYTNGQPSGPMQTVKFAIPAVECYSGTVSFYKTDPQGVVITKTSTEGAKFKLSVGEWSAEAGNDEKGKVTFYNVPSGHTYRLEELTAPAGHEKDTNTYALDLKWKAVENSKIPKGIIKSADGKTTISDSGSRVVNRYLTASKVITVQKTWIDTTEDYKNQAVVFSVYKSGDNTTPLVKDQKMTIANATTPGGKTWKITVTVPGKDAETGKELEYSVKETPIPGYTATYDGLNITNVAAPRTETVTITKVWRVPMPDEPEQTTVDEATPENAQEVQAQNDTQEVQAEATREGETINAAAVATPPDAEITLILNSTDGTHKPFGNPHTLKANEATKKEVNGEYVYETKITVENVPVLADNGKPYTYRVEEAAMTGFHHVGTDMPNGTTFEVTNASDELLTTNVPFHKHWEGDEGHTSARVPVTVVLYANDGTDEKEARRAILTAEDKLGTNENVWAGSFDNLPRYVDDDVTEAKIVYRFEEITEVSGYLTSYDGIDIINTWNETSFRVTKNWVKPESAVTPSVTFELYRSDNDQKPYRTYTMPKEESSYTFADLPLYSTDKQTKYTYTVKEVVPTGYTSAQVGADFTNTIKQVYDVTVQGAIEWDLRGEDENVKPAEVLVQLYAGDKPCVYPADYSDVTLRGEDVTRVAKASEGWTYKFEKAQRYTNGLTADIAYSVREVGADGTPAPDVSTVQFQSVVDAPGTLRSFGAHYREVTYDNAKSTFTANIFNHTDAEVAAYRIDRVYNYTLDGSTTAKSVPGTVEYHQPGTELSVNTEDYIGFDGKTYSFSAGMVSVTVDGSAEMFPVLKAGANTIRLEKTDRVYVVALEYALSETTPPYVPDDPNPPKPPKPTEPTDPTTPPTTEPTTPPTEPTTPPTTEPTTPPTDPTTPPKPPKDPDIRPNPPVLTPEEEEKVDEVIKDVIEHPEHIIKDKDSFEEMFPEVSIEDLPPPLYWGPEFAIVDVPVYEEIVAIDSELVPLGNLPQTGSDLRATATRTALVGVGAMAAAGTIALGGWLVLRRKYREE